MKQITFKRGDGYAYVREDGECKKISLKLNCIEVTELKKLDIKERIKKIKKTNQHKAMTSFGFKTDNGRSYYRDSPELWISFKNSKIYKIKVNGWLEDKYTLEV